MHPLLKIIENRKKDIKSGIVSICSANRYVVEASMNRARKENTYLLIEATANQVNQFGGYTGMRPADFKQFIFEIADKNGFDKDMIILGGDHLGPLVWKDLPETIAMKNAENLVREFVSAGFSKIHLDTSMRLQTDNPNEELKISIIAKRGALLCKAAEEAAKDLLIKPVYIIGSEVPIPGGSCEKDDIVSVTTVDNFILTYETYQKVFNGLGLDKAFNRVIGVVVQPGVEFGDETIHSYDRTKAVELANALKGYDNIVFEGHSTDYQLPELLKQMNDDGIAILKVGPALTFAMREGLMALELIEKAIIRKKDRSRFTKALESSMNNNPVHWIKHYHGSDRQLKIKRKFSYSDRCRYYLPEEKVNAAIDKLIKNLSDKKIPITLISQYMPVQYIKIRRGILKNSPINLLWDKIDNLLDDYYYAIKTVNCTDENGRMTYEEI